MQLPSRRSIVAITALTAGLALSGFGAKEALDTFPERMEAATSDDLSEQGPPITEELILIASGFGLIAVAGLQRIRYVRESVGNVDSEPVVLEPETTTIETLPNNVIVLEEVRRDAAVSESQDLPSLAQ